MRAQSFPPSAVHKGYPKSHPFKHARREWAPFKGPVLNKGIFVSASKIRVVLADDHPRIRAAIRRFLEKSPDISVVGEASNGYEALELVENLSPDLLLLDMEMPLLDGLHVATRLQEIGSPVRILVLSAYDDQEYRMSVLQKGASGYLVKDDLPDTLVQAVHAVARGEQDRVGQQAAE